MNPQEALQILSKALRGSVPVATLLVGILVGATPLGIPGLASVAPFYVLAGVYFWTLHRPLLVPRSAVFAVGLIQDAVLGAPLGLTSAVLLLAQAFVTAQRRFLARKSFWITWLGLGVTAAGACAAGWIIACAYEVEILPLAPVFLQIGATILVYPALATMMASLQNRLLVLR